MDRSVRQSMDPVRRGVRGPGVSVFGSPRQMWSEFVRLHPRLQTTSLRKRNEGPVISFSAFRNVFSSNLKDVLSFRKARLDTCQVCDKIMNRMGHLMALRKRTLSQG